MPNARMNAPARPEIANMRREPLAWRDAPLLAEALATLAWSSAAIAWMPFRRVAEIAGGAVGGTARGDPTHGTDIDRVTQAVQAWARRVPWRTVCFQKGLAVHVMLRRRGVASRMHYGVSPRTQNGLGAHVWVDVGDRTVIGGEEAARFARLASYPADD